MLKNILKLKFKKINYKNQFLLLFLYLPGIFSTTEPLNVVEIDNAYFDESLQSANELDYYYQFPEKHFLQRKKISEKALEREIENARNPKQDTVYPYDYNIASLKLKKTILKILNIEFLTKDIQKRELTVIKTNELNRGEYTEKTLFFRDKHIGTFKVLMLIPNGNKKQYPAIIGLHGHVDTEIVFIDESLGRELVKQGFIVIIPHFRAMQLDKDELEISKKLLLNGFTLMGIRVYETLLVLKYLLYSPIVDKDNIGILAHSGGSSIANLTARATNILKVIATDYRNNFLDINDQYYNDNPETYLDNIHCEVIPELSYFCEVINNKNTLTIPHLELPYGFGENKEIIFDFFNSNLCN